APQASEQTSQAPAAPQAKPSVERSTALATAAPESATSQPSASTPDAVTPTASATTQEPAENKSGPKQAAHVDTPSQHAARPNGPDAAERPQTASAVSDFVQAVHHATPDGSQFAHLQGRDFGQAVAAAAHAMHAGTDAASNLLASAPVPLESLAV